MCGQPFGSASNTFKRCSNFWDGPRQAISASSLAITLVDLAALFKRGADFGFAILKGRFPFWEALPAVIEVKNSLEKFSCFIDMVGAD